MIEITNSKPYDLEERTFQFAKNVRIFVKTLPKTMANIEDGKQLVKASGSVGEYYREGNESLRVCAEISSQIFRVQAPVQQGAKM